MYISKDAIQLETALLKRIIEKNERILGLLQASEDQHERNMTLAEKVDELEAQLKALTGESIKEDEHGTDPGAR